MKERNGWWVTAISLAMVAYGLACVWKLWDTAYAGGCGGGGAIARLSFIVSALGSTIVWGFLPILIGVVGALGLLRALLRQPDDTTTRGSGPLLQPYILAWRRLWSSKWLLWIVAAVGLLGAVGSIASVFPKAWRGYAQMGRMGEVSPSLQSAARYLWTSLPSSMQDAIHRFVPSIRPLGIGLLAVLVPVLFWVLLSTSRISRQFGGGGKEGFFRFCSILLVAACIVSFWAYCVTMSSVWAEMHPVAYHAAKGVGDRVAPPNAIPGRVISHPNGSFGGKRMGPNSGFVFEMIAIIIGTIFGAMMMGGVLGSLVRSRNAEEVSRSTFLADAMKHFEPLLGIYLIYELFLTYPRLLLAFFQNPVHRGLCDALSLVPLPMLVVLLMYAPLGVVTQGMRFSNAVRHSLRVWKDTLWSTIRLIAVGTFLFGLLRAVDFTVLSLMPDRLIWLVLGSLAVLGWISVAANLLILLAVWEFYQANVTDREPV